MSGGQYLDRIYSSKLIHGVDLKLAVELVQNFEHLLVLQSEQTCNTISPISEHPAKLIAQQCATIRLHTEFIAFRDLLGSTLELNKHADTPRPSADCHLIKVYNIILL